MTQASPTVINDITDLYRILDEQPQWAEALRRRLLSPELLAMPQRQSQLTEQLHELREIVGQLAETTAENGRQISELRETAAEHTRQISELRETAAEHTRQLEALTVQVKELRETAEENTRQLVELRRVTELQTARMNRMESDISKVKGLSAQLQTNRTIGGIAVDLDLLEPVEVPINELVRFAIQLQLDRPTRRSFVDADLVFLAQDAHDTPIYCAVEVSWTVGPWDLRRARRNAELLQQATGIAALAVVAGNRYEDGLDWDGIVWFQVVD